MENKLRNELDKNLSADQFKKIDGNWIFMNQGDNAPFRSKYRGVGIGFKFQPDEIKVELYATNAFSNKPEFNDVLNNIEKARSMFPKAKVENTVNATHKIYDTNFKSTSSAANFAYALTVLCME
ncbi:hypothetical protein ACSEYT_01915 [Vibrio cidicii]|uniref:hypothetical protein n=1 Tax=Vibrio cidicii TaxID=1763883 RepID=UPI003F512E45